MALDPARRPGAHMNDDVWQDALRPAGHVVGRRLEDTFFLVNLETNSVFELNATGTEIWLWLEQHGTLVGCFEHLQTKFDVSAAELRVHVEPLVLELVREGLLSRPEEKNQ
jgi:Coenzyme PQQ synthesis protein D (PqqD)